MGINFKKIKNHLMTGMSYMMPMIVVGGISYAGFIAFGGTAVAGEGMVIKNEFLPHVQETSGAGLFLMIPALVGYIAYVIVGRPALAPGLVAGYTANTGITIGGNAVKIGLLGALALGLMIGYLAKYTKKIHYPELIKSVVSMLIVSVVTSFVVCISYMYIPANPIGMAMGGVESFLISLSGRSKIVLGIIIGMMVTVDMGGPVNKTARLFPIGMMAEGHHEFFGICAASIYTASLGMGLATSLVKNKYTREERDIGKASLFMGLIGISKGAIPLAAADPIKAIPSTMAGGAVGDAITAVAGVKDYAPHGGSIVLPVVNERIWFVIVTIVGTLIIAILANLLKKPVAQTGLADK